MLSIQKATDLGGVIPAGGNADIVARIQAEALSDELGVPVNVVNTPVVRIFQRR